MTSTPSSLSTAEPVSSKMSKCSSKLGSQVKKLSRPFKWRKHSSSTRDDTTSTETSTKSRRGSQGNGKKQRRSLTVLASGVHIGWKEKRIARSILSDKSKSTKGKGKKRSKTLIRHRDKAMPAKAAVTFDEALAARHARVLERIIASGTSIELEEIKAKRALKAANDKSYSSDKVQPYSVVAPHKVKELKEALLDVELANGIIGELRAMDVDEDIVLAAFDSAKVNTASKLGDGQQSSAVEALEAIASADTKAIQETQAKSQPKKRKVKAKPVRVVCLNCTDGDAASIRQQDAKCGTRRVTVQTLYAKGESTIAQGRWADVQKGSTEEGSLSAPTGMMSTAATVAGGAIGAIGQYIGYGTQEAVAVNPTITTAVAPMTGTAKKGPAPNLAPIGDIAEYGHEIYDDVKAHDYAEAFEDGVRLATAGVAVVQPVAGAVAKAVEDQVMPANKVLGQITKTMDQQTSAAVTPDHAMGHKPLAGAATAQNTAAIAMTTQTRSEIKVKTVRQTSAPQKKPFSIDAATVTNFMQSPTSATIVRAADRAGLYDALGLVAGGMAQAAQGGADAMQDVKPPADRMAIFIHWWGFEITMPSPSMHYLGTAHSVSAAFITFLTTMATTTGAPELLPFIRYISTFMDMEFNAIKSQNHGQGVVVAATWLMPLALVPRPWDYGVEGQAESSTQKSAQGSQDAEKKPAQNGEEQTEEQRDEEKQTAQAGASTQEATATDATTAPVEGKADEDRAAEATRGQEDAATKSDTHSQRTITPRKKPSATSQTSEAKSKTSSPDVPGRASSPSSQKP